MTFVLEFFGHGTRWMEMYDDDDLDLHEFKLQGLHNRCLEIPGLHISTNVFLTVTPDVDRLSVMDVNN